jgi:hypothetical protein
VGALAATATIALAPVSPRPRPLAGGKGERGSILLVESQSRPSRSRVCSPPMLRGGVRFYRWSMTPLRSGFPSGVGDAEATRCKGIISPNFFRSPMAIYSDVNGEVGETCPRVESRHIVVFR